MARVSPRNQRSTKFQMFELSLRKKNSSTMLRTTPVRNSVAALTPVRVLAAKSSLLTKSVTCCVRSSSIEVSTGRGADVIQVFSCSQPPTAEETRLSHSLRIASTIPLTTPLATSTIAKNEASVAHIRDQPLPISQRTSGPTAAERISATSTETTTTRTRSSSHTAPAATAAISSS